MPEQREKSMDEAERPEVEGHLGAARSDADSGEQGEGYMARNEDEGPDVEGHLGASRSDADGEGYMARNDSGEASV